MLVKFAFNVLIILTCSYLFHENKMEDLQEQEKKINIVDDLEIQYYEIQLELYEVKFEILKYEEILLVTQLDSIKRLIKGNIYISMYIFVCLNYTFKEIQTILSIISCILYTEIF